MYTKLFGSIVNSSIWSEDAETCKLWVTMMALADRRGCVYAAIPGLAKAAMIKIEKVEEAIKKFLRPDKHSADARRAPERAGRRIEVIDGGWMLLNAGHYNSITSTEDRARQNREAAKRYRDKKHLQRSQQSNADVPADASAKSSSIVINRNQSSSPAITKNAVSGKTSAKSSSKISPQLISAHLNSTQLNSDSEKKERKKEKSGEPQPVSTPTDLRDLTLYAADPKLCRAWEDLKRAAADAYPGIDIIVETKKAHAWEISNPSNRKTNRTRFLNNWMSKAQQDASKYRQKPGSEALAFQGKTKPCGRCKGIGSVYSKTVDPHDPKGEKQVDVASSCGVCGGRGKLPA